MILDKESGGLEALERSIACFWVAVYGQEKSTATPLRKHELLSFPWIAATACLQQVEKFQNSIPY
jgi:hypothetical protein